MTPAQIAALEEAAARRALEAAADMAVTTRTWPEKHTKHCCCETCELNKAEDAIRAIDPAQFRSDRTEDRTE